MRKNQFSGIRRNLRRFGTVLALTLALMPPAWGQALFAATLGQVRVAQPETLEIWNRPIIALRAAIGDLTPQARVVAARERIEQLPYTALESGQVHAHPATVGELSGLVIMVNKKIVFSILPQDVDPDSGQTLEQMGQEAVAQLTEVLRARFETQRLPALLRAVAGAVVATLVFGLALWGIQRLRGRALRQLTTRHKLAPLHIGGVNIRPYFAAMESGATKVSFLTADLIVGYLWLTFVLKLFPFTAPWGAALGRHLLNLLTTLGTNALHAIPGLFTVMIIFMLTKMLTRSISVFFRSVETGRLRAAWLDSETARATRRLVMVLIWIFALTVAYPYIPGSGTDAFKGISVFVGLMVSLGSAGFINQIMSGLVVVYARMLRTGEYVRVGEIEGTVGEVGVLSTKIKTPREEEIIIPNGVLVSTTVTNYSRTAENKGSIIATGVTIGYDTPWRQVHGLLQRAAERTPGVRKAPKPVVMQSALGDFYVEYQLLVVIDRPDERIPIRSALHAEILDAFNEFGVQIMSPHFMTQPEQAVVVPQAQWYAAPTVEKEVERVQPAA